MRNSVYQALSPPPLKGPGDEARLQLENHENDTYLPMPRLCDGFHVTSSIVQCTPEEGGHVTIA